MGRPTFMWKTGDPEMVTPKRVGTYRPKHSDTSLFRGGQIWQIKEKKISTLLSMGKTLKAIFLASGRTAQCRLL